MKVIISKFSHEKKTITYDVRKVNFDTVLNNFDNLPMAELTDENGFVLRVSSLYQH